MLIHSGLISIHSIELQNSTVHLIANNSLCLDLVQAKVHVHLDLDLQPRGSNKGRAISTLQHTHSLMTEQYENEQKNCALSTYHRT